MKTFSRLLFLGVVITILSSCEAGVKKDFTTGLKVTNNGLSYNDSYLLADGKKTSGSEFSLNTGLELHIEGVSGYTEENGVVFIGASMSVIDDKNTEILHYPDLFADYDSIGISSFDAKMITLSFNTGDPLEPGHKYIWKTRLWDKKGKGEIVTEMEISLK
jgi:hypothetical protein